MDLGLNSDCTQSGHSNASEGDPREDDVYLIQARGVDRERAPTRGMLDEEVHELLELPGRVPH